MEAWPTRPSRRFSGSVGKAFQILAVFSVQRPELTASEIAAEVGMDRSTTHRFVTTLLEIGAIVQDRGTRRYRLGLPLLSYAFVVLNTLEVRRIALSYLHELHRDLEATVSLGVRDGAEVVLVERQSLAGPWVPPGGYEIGFRFPMHASATGLAILAFLAPDEIESVLRGLELKVRTPNTLRTPAELDQRLDEIRRDGYATSDEELAVGLRSVAVPILGADGSAVAAISLARTTRTSSATSIEDLVHQFVPKLQAVAERISTALGHRPFVMPRT